MRYSKWEAVYSCKTCYCHIAYSDYVSNVCPKCGSIGHKGWVGEKSARRKVYRSWWKFWDYTYESRV